MNGELKSDEMKLFSIILLSLVLLACSTDPEEINYGKDICHFCKMTLVDSKFGAELVTTHGKVYKFDDISCFIQYYDLGYDDPQGYAHKLVVDFVQPGKLIPAADAFYLKSDEVVSPMSSHLAAFEKLEEMNKLKKQGRGIYMAWGEVITQYK